MPIDKLIKKSFGVSLLSAAAATTLVACSAGQISQVATQEPAINGTGGGIENIMLRNVHIQAVQTSDALQPGTDVQLIFTATNDSPEVPDRLVRVTSDVGTVTLTGDTDVPANGLLEVGNPDGIDELAELAGLSEPDEVAEATVSLSQPISNGLTYAFTFTFEEAGEKVLQVPISAGNAPRQGDELSGGDTHSGGH